MNCHAQRNKLQGHGATNFWLDRFHRAADDRVHLEALRSQDVATDAIGILNESEVKGEDGVVLNRLHNGVDAVLATNQIKLAIATIVSATTSTTSDHTVVVATASLGQGRDETLLWTPGVGDLFVEVHRRVAAAVGNRFVDANGHGTSPAQKSSMDSSG